MRNASAPAMHTSPSPAATLFLPPHQRASATHQCQPECWFQLLSGHKGQVHEGGLVELGVVMCQLVVEGGDLGAQAG